MTALAPTGGTDSPATPVAAPRQHRFLGMRISPITRRRIDRFKLNRRAYWSMVIFLILFILSLFAEFIANDKPLLVHYDGKYYFPIFEAVPETEYGGFFPTEAVYHEPEVQALIREKGWFVMPLIPYGNNTPAYDLDAAAPTPPDWNHLLGTDDEARDVLTRVIYGFRISVLFGLALTIASSAIGILIGLAQGYFGGLLDLLGQRGVEIWTSLPVLYILIIMASIVEPNFWWLLGLMLLFSWTALVGLVRAETLRARNFDYVRASKALGVSDATIMRRHVLPNAMVATITFLPFITTGSITQLTALDFLGFGLPPGSASLGELLKQGKENLQAPWLALTGFFTIGTMLTLLVFIGEGVRDAFDPRKAN
jgi:microcin C transport system permease protein